jgi:hypothetical protein
VELGEIGLNMRNLDCFWLKFVVENRIFGGFWLKFGTENKTLRIFG